MMIWFLPLALIFELFSYILVTVLASSGHTRRTAWLSS